MKYFLTLLVLIFVITCSKGKEEKVYTIKVIPNETEQRVDITVNNQPFTSYIYSDKIEALKKPVLYPLITARGTAVTRGFPIDPRVGERVDHPHHIGYWLNYGDVNGLDFWNNSNAISEEKAAEMGHIKQESIKNVKSGNGEGILEVTASWLNNDNQKVLNEDTKFVFHAAENRRCIDRITTLTALDKTVLFNDNKEGMLGIRVARELEHPSDKPVTVSDAQGNVTVIEPSEQKDVSGQYLSSEGVKGLDTWGKRAKWNTLFGTIKGEKIALAIFDHPDNTGYPTYWHARGYGLFAANPLGQKVFSDGAEELHFTLEPKQSVTFKYRMIIFSGEPTQEDIEKAYQDWAKTK